MLNLNELFDTKPSPEEIYNLEDPWVTPSYQVYNITSPDGNKYQVKFDNRPQYGDQVQAIRFGQPTADQKKFKPLVKKISKPLEFFGALKYMMYQHTFVNQYTKKKKGFILILQKGKISIPISLVTKLAYRFMRPEFTVVQDAVMPTAEELGGLGLKDGEFDVLVFRRTQFPASKVFNGEFGPKLIGELTPAATVLPTNVPASATPSVYDAAKDLYDDPVLKTKALATPIVAVKTTPVPAKATPEAAPETVAKPSMFSYKALTNKISQEQITDLSKKLEYSLTPVISDGMKMAMAGSRMELIKLIKGMPGGNASGKNFLKALLAMLEKDNSIIPSYTVKVPRNLTLEETVNVFSSFNLNSTTIGIEGGKLAMVGDYVALKKKFKTLPGGYKKSKMFIKLMLAVMDGSFGTAPLPPMSTSYAETYGNNIRNLLQGKPVQKNPVAPSTPAPSAPEAFVNVKPVTGSDVTKWFWSPLKESNSGYSYGIGFYDAKKSDWYTFVMSKVSSPENTFGFYWFKNQDEAILVKKYLMDNKFYEYWAQSKTVKLGSGFSYPGGHKAGDVVSILDYVIPAVYSGDGTAKTFIDNIKKIFVVAFNATSDGSKTVERLELNQIYKWYPDGAGADGVVNNFIVTKAPASAPSAPSASVEKVAALKKPKQGLANGLRAKTISPETVAWLSKNPPKTFLGKQVKVWESYWNTFDVLSKTPIEVNGFELKFDSTDPAKLFKQLDGFEKLVGPNDSNLKLLKTKLDSASSIGSLMLSEFQQEHFPSSSALSAYTGSYYTDINRVLRGTKSDSEITFKKISECDNYYDKHGARLPSNVIVYRGQSILVSEILGLLEGHEYVMHSYVSTSTDLSTANSFMQGGVNILAKHFVTNEGAVRIIKSASDLPEDPTTKLRCMLVISGLDNCLSVIPGSWGNHQSEREIIINRGSRLKIDKSIPIKAYSVDGTGGALTTCLIYCTIVSDGKIDYEVNEMTEQKQDTKRKFSELNRKQELDKKVQKALIIDDFVKNGKAPKAPKPGDERWTDNMFG